MVNSLLCSDGIQRDVIFSFPYSLIKKLKQELVNKYKKCELCPNTDKLEIHHIDYNRFHNNPENLKLLCRNCHINWHRQNPDIRNWRRLTKIEIKGNKVYVKDYELYTANELRELERLEAQA